MSGRRRRTHTHTHTHIRTHICSSQWSSNAAEKLVCTTRQRNWYAQRGIHSAHETQGTPSCSKHVHQRTHRLAVGVGLARLNNVLVRCMRRRMRRHRGVRPWLHRMRPLKHHVLRIRCAIRQSARSCFRRITRSGIGGSIVPECKWWRGPQGTCHYTHTFESWAPRTQVHRHTGTRARGKTGVATCHTPR